MRNRIYYTYIIIAAFLTIVTSSCCERVEPEKKNIRRTVLLYFAGNNSLGDDSRSTNYAKDNFETLKASGFLPEQSDTNNILLVFYHIVGESPVLKRLCKKNNLCIEEDLITYDIDLNSATDSTLNAVLSKADQLYPSTYKGLILWSHGSGWLPQGYYNNPSSFTSSFSSNTLKENIFCPANEYPDLSNDPYRDIVKSFGEDSSKEINIELLSSALPGHYEYIIFDACLMGGVEVAYELKDNCDYVAFSQTEILADGFPYDKITDYLFHQTDSSSIVGLKMLCKAYFDQYNIQQGIMRSATISLINTSELDDLAYECQSIFSANRSQIRSFIATDVQEYFRYNRHWFYDLDDYISRFCTADQYSRFQIALSKSVVYKATTDYFLEIPIKKFSGLSTYILEPENNYLNNYYRSLKWNQATGLVN